MTTTKTVTVERHATEVLKQALTWWHKNSRNFYRQEPPWLEEARKVVYPERYSKEKGIA